MKASTFKRSCLAAALPLGLAVLTAGAAHAQIGVQVNGTPVRFGTVGPVQMGGRVMIPLRSVAEALGAAIDWNAANRTVSGSKNGKTFELVVGRPTASVDGRLVNLDVPATMQSGTVLVPLRFVAEALGADVKWRAVDQQVLVATNGTDAGTPAGAPGAITGPVTSVNPQANPPTITVHAGGIDQTYPLSRDAIILRGAAGQRGIQANVTDLRPGDTAQLRVDSTTGNVTAVEAQYAAASGPSMTRSASGRPTFQFPQSAPEVAAPQIQSVTNDAQGVLRAGDVLTVRMSGAPHGQASFDVGRLARSVPMTEETPGNYVGTYTVRRGDQDAAARVVTHLRSSGQVASHTAPAPVAILTQALAAPRITSPKAGDTVGNGFVVTGAAPPGSKVSVDVTYSGRQFGLLPVQGSAGSQEVTVDGEGRFQTQPFTLQTPPGLSRVDYQIKAATVDPAGNKSDATAVAVKVK